MKNNKHKMGYEIVTCPICKSKTFNYISYSEYPYGVVEQHGICNRCGYIVEQEYTQPMYCFLDIKKGFKNSQGVYYPKDIKKHKRIRCKIGIKNTDYEINPRWAYYV